MEERVELFTPNSKKENTLAQAMEAFSSFVLYEERDSCLSILRMEKYSEEVGELQGGNDDYSIYRVVITNNPKDAVSELLSLFYNNNNNNNNKNNNNNSTQQSRKQQQQTKHSDSILTKESLQEYMLGMCSRFSSLQNSNDSTSSHGEYNQLGNVMLVFSFGSTEGQVRHIDHTHPNAMVCTYMSQDCPSTIVYSSSSSGYGSTISNCEELIDHWQDGNSNDDNDGSSQSLLRRQLALPNLVKDILIEQEHTDLSGSYFSFWKTLHHQLQNFGKLYLVPQKDDDDDDDDEMSVLCELATEPGTTLIASGNAIHAGPPTNAPRMFAYAIGVYENDDNNDKEDNHNNNNEDGKVNDGEVQYSPALFHLDLCCLVLDWMRNMDEYADRRKEHFEAKKFMISLLVKLILNMQRLHGNETYARLLSDERSQAREWMGRVVHAGANTDPNNNNNSNNTLNGSDENLETLIQQGIAESDIIFAIPDVVVTTSSTAKRKQQRDRKKKSRSTKDRQQTKKMTAKVTN